MNREETSFWAGTFLPGEVKETEVEAFLEGDTAGVVQQGAGDQDWAVLRGGLTLLTTEDAALTNGLAEIPTGLTVDAAPLELRCEMLLAGNPGTDILAHTLTSVASLVATQPEAYPLQPGTVVPMIGARAHLSRSTTVRHGVFVPPFMWSGQCPNMTEQPGDVHTHQLSADHALRGGNTEPASRADSAQTSAGLGRMTVLLQILMITDAELELIEDKGTAGLIDELLSASTDLMDWQR